MHETRPDNVRPRETSRLYAALDALDEGRGQIIELAGGPGSGKTRLLAGMMNEAERRGMVLAHIRCTELEQCMPYRSFSMLLGVWPMDDLLAQSPAEDRELIGRIIMRAHNPCRDPEHSAGWERYRAGSAVRALLGASAPTRLVVVLDDFHWADQESVELVDDLVARPLGGPLLLVIAQRPRQASHKLRSTLAHGIELGSVTRIELPPLTLGQSAQLLGMHPQDPLLGELHEAGQGNPLYLTALSSGPGDGLPAQVVGLLLGEIAPLPGRDSIVAGAAAVLGEHCDIEALSAVTELGTDEVEAAVEALVSRDVLRVMDRRRGFTFRHPILGQVVYEDADSTWRLCAHRRALRVLLERGAPATELAAHVERCLSHADLDDLGILRRAAEEVMPTAPQRALRWLQIILDTFPEGSMDARTRAELFLLLTKALGLTGRLEESRDLLHQVIQLTRPGEHALRARAVAFCAVVECFLGHYAEARALLADEVADILTIADPPPEAATLLIEHGMIGALDGQMPACEQVRLAIRLAQRHRDRVAEAGAFVLNALCDAFKHLPDARESLAAAAEFTDRLSDNELSAHPEYLGVLGWTEMLVGLFGEAERHFTRGATIARKHGQDYILPALLLGLANVHRHTRHLADAYRLALEARELAERIDSEQLCGLALALEAQILVWLEPGDAGKALVKAEKSVGLLRSGDFYWNIVGSVALASVSVLTGDPRRAASVLLDAGHGPDLSRIPRVLRTQCFLVLLTASLDAGETGNVWVEKAEAAAESLDLPASRAYAHVARAMLLRRSGDVAGAVEHSQRAADMLAATGMVHARAWLLLTTAEHAAALGHERRVASLLAHAKELGRRCGGVKIDEEAERLERAIGDDAHRAAATPPSSGGPRPAAATADLSVLTHREREVAAIAGTGLKTREIAAELSLSPRTVDVHLTRIYRKLNISSRAVLARLMAESREHAKH